MKIGTRQSSILFMSCQQVTYNTSTSRHNTTTVGSPCCTVLIALVNQSINQHVQLTCLKPATLTCTDCNCSCSMLHLKTCTDCKAAHPNCRDHDGTQMLTNLATAGGWRWLLSNLWTPQGAVLAGTRGRSVQASLSDTQLRWTGSVSESPVPLHKVGM